MRLLEVDLTLEYKRPFRAGFGMLPLYRGAFGAVLRRASCFTRRASCEGCEGRGRCVYSHVFETPVPSDPHPLLARYPFAPHPFIFKPGLPAGESRQHRVGLTLIGRAISHLSYFIHAFVEMGRQGIGEACRTFQVTSVVERIPGAAARELYDPKRDRLDEAEGFRLALPRLEATGEGPAELAVEFLTPYRFRENGEITDRVDARNLAAQAARRMTELFETHGERNDCGYGVDLVRDYLDRVAAIPVVRSELSWVEVNRYSARQKRSMILGGVIGRVVFAGKSGPLVPLLRAAEHLSLGKSTSFGFGQVRVTNGRA